jgi:hypothetical protein
MLSCHGGYKGTFHSLGVAMTNTGSSPWSKLGRARGANPFHRSEEVEHGKYKAKG